MTAGIWELDAAGHKGRWEWTGQRALLLKLVATQLAEYPWLVSEVA